MPRPRTTTAQVRHNHHLNNQTGPAGEMLRALSRARLRIILLPREACPFPLVEDVDDKILAELGVDVSGLLLMSTLRLSNVLELRHVFSIAIGCIT